MAKLLVQTTGALRELATLATSGGAPSAGGIAHMDATGRLDPSFVMSDVQRTLADQSTSGTTLLDITGLGLTVAANATYRFDFFVRFGCAASTTGIKLQLNGPAGVTGYQIRIPTAQGTGVTSGTESLFHRTSFAVSGTSGSSGGVVLAACVSGYVTTTAAGVLQLQFCTEVLASAATIKAGSFGSLQRVA